MNDLKLLLIRDLFTKTTTLGKLYLDGVFECHTLEDTDRKLEDGGIKIHGQSAIPRGSFEIIIDYSTRFQKDMPHLLNIPGFEGIRIHSGNTSADTEGCILVGTVRGDNSISLSRPAFNQLFKKLETAFEAGRKITIEVR